MTRQEFEDNLVEMAAKHAEQSAATVRNAVDFIAAAANPDAPRADHSPQSALEHRFDLLDPPSMYAMTNVLYHGAIKYGEESWRTIPVRDHLNHLIAHAMAWLAGNRDDQHLVNIMCRAMFACGRDIMDVGGVAAATIRDEEHSYRKRLEKGL